MKEIFEIGKLFAGHIWDYFVDSASAKLQKYKIVDPAHDKELFIQPQQTGLWKHCRHCQDEIRKERSRAMCFWARGDFICAIAFWKRPKWNKLDKHLKMARDRQFLVRDGTSPA